MNHLIRSIILLFLLTIPPAANAADSLRLIRSIPMQARIVTMDELGNCYVVKTDNLLVRYNERGDSTGFYRTIVNGDIGTIDARNPLLFLAYYPSYSKVILLDRMLSLKSELNLRQQNIFSPTAIAASADGNLWVYDPFNAKLLKMDENGSEVSASNDLRQQVNFVPTPTFILERDRRVYVCDTSHGILVFDQFATYVNTLPIFSINQLQAFDQQLVFCKGDTLHNYNMENFRETLQPLPEAKDTILDAVIAPGRMAVLYKNKLNLYATINPEKR